MNPQNLHSSQMPSSLQRKQFRFSNAVIGLSLVTFVVGVYAYSIYAVGQDKFEDVEKRLKENQSFPGK